MRTKRRAWRNCNPSLAAHDPAGSAWRPRAVRPAVSELALRVSGNGMNELLFRLKRGLGPVLLDAAPAIEITGTSEVVADE
jgi:hypothetical protein